MVKTWASRNMIHLCIWGVLGSYLALLGPVRAALIGDVGKGVPVTLDSAHIRSAISLTFREPTTTRVDGQDVYFLSGYAPPGGTELPVDRSATAIVLVDDRGAALRFDSQASILPSAISSLRAHDRELAASVVSVYISGAGLRSGAYRLGIIYAEGTGANVLLLTDRFLVRTPNTLRLYGYRPSVRDPFEDIVLRLKLSAGSVPKVMMGYDFWELARVESAPPGTYQLLGYAFPFAADAPVDQYHKRIVLIGEDLAPHLFDAETVIRPDVGEYFAGLGLAVEASAFSLRIADDALEPGRYRLAILYTAHGVAPAYWPTDRYIEFTGNAPVLLPRVPPNQ